MKKWFSCLALVLSLCMLMGAAGAESSGTLPLCEGEPQKLSMMYMQIEPNGIYVDPDEIWLFKWMEKYMNIDLDIEAIPSATVGERWKMMLNLNELPDVVMYKGTSNEDIVQYGMNQGLFIPLNDLIDQYAPNIKAYFEANPGVKAQCTLSDGNIYALPNTLEGEWSQNILTNRMFWDTTWLAENNIAVPTTVDEYIDVMLKYRDSDANGNGIADEIPFSAHNIIYMGQFLWNANGLVGVGGLGNGVNALMPTVNVNEPGKGQLAAMYNDMYYDVIDTMRRMFADKLIDNEIYLSNPTYLKALAAEDRLLSFGYYTMYDLGYADYETWSASSPIVNPKYNEKMIWPQSKNINFNRFMISANCENPELAIKFADWFFTEEAAVYCMNGPQLGVTDMVGGDETMGWHVVDGQVVSEMGGMDLGSYQARTTFNDATHVGFGASTPVISKLSAQDVVSNSGAALFWRQSVYANQVPYYSELFPNVYFEPEVNDRIIELTTILNDIVSINEALFITGDRPMEEFSSYLKELEDNGLTELNNYYVEAYQNYLNAL